MATEKEATVFVIDTSSSMRNIRNGRDASDLDWAMQYVWDKITTAVATGRKTLFQGVVCCGTSESKNDLVQDDESFANISVAQELKQTFVSDLSELQQWTKPSKTNKGDLLSAVILAIHKISVHCKKLKYRRQIIVVAGANNFIDDDQVDEIISKIRDENIHVSILGVDFDDAELGYKEEAKSSIKLQNEELLRRLAEESNGSFGTAVEAISQLEIPRVKTVKPILSYRGLLTLGNPNSQPTLLEIPVERYPRTMIAKPPSAKSFVLRSDVLHGDTQSSMTLTPMETQFGGNADSNGTGLAGVKFSRMYEVKDDSAPDGKREVAREELEKGYLYGRTAVHISESDQNVVMFESLRAYEILGFVDAQKYDRFMNLSVSCCTVAQKASETAAMALSSLIHALYELEMYAVARLVIKENKNPLLVLLMPSIEADYECLLDVQLPFAEDCRSFRFPPLDEIKTVSGKIIKEHRNLPDARLKECMNKYVDQMDLSIVDIDDEDLPDEYAQMENTYSPILHRLNQALKTRAIDPAAPIAEPLKILSKYSKPPTGLLAKSKLALKELEAAAKVSKVPPKVKGRKQDRERDKPLSGLNIDALLGKEKKSKISAQNAIPEFKQMLATSEDPNVMRNATSQMGEIIRSLIKSSFGNSAYGRTIEALRVAREELIALEEPEPYNELVRDLKKDILSGRLGGERREMWYDIRSAQLGLIKSSECDVSRVGEDDAKAFLSARVVS